MSWIYRQRSHTLIGPNGVEYSEDVYSGSPAYMNDPASETVQCGGPIPRGTWDIDLQPYTGNGGPYSLRLIPRGHNAHGRTDFVIHGDSIAQPGAASKGCIIAPLTVRQAIVNSGDSISETRE